MIAMVMIMVTTMMMMKMIFLVKGRPAVSGADGMMAAAAGEAGLHIDIIISVITIITFNLPSFLFVFRFVIRVNPVSILSAAFP